MEENPKLQQFMLETEIKTKKEGHLRFFAYMYKTSSKMSTHISLKDHTSTKNSQISIIAC